MSFRHLNPHPSPLLPDMSLADVRDYERKMHEQTNSKVVNCHEQQEHSAATPSSLDDIEIHDKESVCAFSLFLHFIAFCLCLMFTSRAHDHPRATARSVLRYVIELRWVCEKRPCRQLPLTGSDWLINMVPEGRAMCW